MKLLMPGGTECVGRAITEGALARGREVTVFHCGRHADTWAWPRTLGGVAAQRSDRPAPGLAVEREAALLGV
ncbi:hypothetical protein [Streptomyces sp. NPDC090021]|uniref:hypothetical protein n=1 Tax=Streptomyces sp. NPDC090021 TaxID=3365919 RepID=UPI00382F56A9